MKRRQKRKLERVIKLRGTVNGIVRYRKRVYVVKNKELMRHSFILENALGDATLLSTLVSFPNQEIERMSVAIESDQMITYSKLRKGDSEKNEKCLKHFVKPSY